MFDKSNSGFHFLRSFYSSTAHKTRFQLRERKTGVFALFIQIEEYMVKNYLTP